MESLITKVLLIILTFQSAFFAVFLFTQKSKKPTSNYFLGLFLTFLAFHMAFNLLEGEGVINRYGSITLGFSAMYGPLLYLYVKSLQLNNFRLVTRTYLHFLPFTLITALVLIAPNLEISFVGFFIILLLYVYLIASVVSVRRYQKIIKQTQSRYDGIALKWSVQVIVVCMVVVLMDFFNSLFQLNIFPDAGIFFIFVLLSLLTFVNMVVFKGLKQPTLFAGIGSEDELIFKESQTKYVNSQLQQPELDAIATRIEAFFKREKPYLNPELDLVGLSKSLETSPRIISQVINANFKTNFSDYTNDYRIEEAKWHLEHSSEMNITEILYEVGFNSKSSFYAYFKKKIGISPLQYRKDHKS